MTASAADADALRGRVTDCSHVHRRRMARSRDRIRNVPVTEGACLERPTFLYSAISLDSRHDVQAHGGV